jgi:hypothetical protein
VLRDADLDRTVHGVVADIFAATGQTCLAGSRRMDKPRPTGSVSRILDCQRQRSKG